MNAISLIGLSLLIPGLLKFAAYEGRAPSVSEVKTYAQDVSGALLKCRASIFVQHSMWKTVADTRLNPIHLVDALQIENLRGTVSTQEAATATQLIIKTSVLEIIRLHLEHAFEALKALDVNRLDEVSLSLVEGILAVRQAFDITESNRLGQETP